MQEVKLLIRQVGVPTPELDVISVGDLEEYIAYNFTSQSYELKHTHFLGDVQNSNGGVAGYKVAFVFVRDGDTTEPAGPGESAGPASRKADAEVEKPKRGKKAKK